MTFRQIVGALGVASVVSVISVSPALAVSQPVQKAAKVAATPLPQKPEQHQAVAPVATPVSHSAPVAPVAPPVKPTPAQTQPVQHPLPTAVPPLATAQPPVIHEQPAENSSLRPSPSPVTERETVAEAQRPLQPTTSATPSPNRETSSWTGSSSSSASSAGQSSGTPAGAAAPGAGTSSATSAPVQRTVAQPVKVADAKQTDTLAKQAKDDERKPLPAQCGTKSDVSHSVLRVSGGLATGSFDVATGCHVTVTLASYEKHDSHISHQTLFAYVTDDYGQGHHVIQIAIPSCNGQEDMVRGAVIKKFGSGPGGEGFYGDRKLAYTYNNGTGFCGEQTPPPVVVPPTPKPTEHPTPSPTTKPTPTSTPPVVQITCDTNHHRVGEVCVPNVPPTPYPCDLGSKPNKQGVCQPVPTPKVKPPVSKPPVVASPVVKTPKVAVPVSRIPQTTARQPRLVANHVPATVQATPATSIQRTPRAPNTGSGPSRLADTGLPVWAIGLALVAISLGGLLVITSFSGRAATVPVKEDDQS